MKKTSRKLLSLLMAFAIICSMVPGAFAAGDDYSDYSKYWLCMAYTGGEHYPVPDNVGTVCGFCGTRLSYGSSYYPGYDASYYGHDHRYTYVNSTYHSEECFSHQNCAYYTAQYVPHTTNSSGYCVYCEKYVGTTGTTGYVAQISQSSLSLRANGDSSTLYVSPYTGGSSFDSVVWRSSNDSVATVSSTGYSSYATVTGVATGTATIYAYVYSGGTLVDTVACTVTVGNTSTGYFYITDNTGNTSGQLAANDYMLLSASLSYLYSGITNPLQQSDLNSLTWTTSNASVAYFGGIYGTSTGYSTTSGSSVYLYGGQAGTATITATLTISSGTYAGTYTASYAVTVGNTSNVSVNYSLTTGESLTLDSKSFEDFWSQVTSGYGSLNYVVFGSATGSVGSLSYRRNNSTTGTAVGSTAFYVSPSYNQYGISSVTFTPSKATNSSYRTGTLAVPFTAYGTDSYYGYNYSSANTSYRGTLYIMVTNGKVADIQYKASGSAVALAPADFTSVYRTALNTNTSSTFYIQLQDVPTAGDLYYNYGSNSYYGYATGTRLTSSNIGSMRFSSAVNAAYGIDDLSYVPGSSRSTDTVTYVAYSSATGGTPLYVGKIVFTAGAEPKVEYYAPINTTVGFSADDFYSNSDLYYMEYLSFGTPSSGTLYKNYANGTGTRVTSGAAFTLTGTGSASVSPLSTLTYVPAANYTGVVTIPFTGSSLLGSSVSGTVKIYVAKTFPDLAGYSWASNHILRLTAEGVVGGNTDGTFAPGRSLSYGEALKMILEATGTSATISTVKNVHWANNYLTKAYQKGIVSSMNVDLDSKITRTEVAELAAKALGISAASRIDSGIVGPTDSTNGYVYALYNAGILNGSNDTGANRYNGSSTINRAEISKIICLVSDYYSANK